MSSMTDRCRGNTPTVIMAPESPTSTSPPARSKPQKVSPQHTLERVRNNQRQHRARRRVYIETLEKNLREAEQTVSALRSQVEALQAEHARCHHRTLPEQWSQPQDDTSPSFLFRSTLGTAIPAAAGPVPDMMDLGALSLPGPPPPPNLDFPVADELPIGLGPPQPERDATTPTRGVAVSPPSLGSIPTSSSAYAPDLAFAATSYRAASRPGALLPAATTPIQLFAHARPCSSCGSSSNLQQKVDALDQTVFVQGLESSLQLPDYISQSAIEAYFSAGGDGESTILCSEAYLLISQQNVKGVSQEDVASWLWNGFRKSLQPGWGCRVRTDMLFSLLAFISEG